MADDAPGPEEPRRYQPRFDEEGAPAAPAPASEDATAEAAAPQAGAGATAAATAAALAYDEEEESPWRGAVAGGVGVLFALSLGSIFYPLLPQSWLSLPMLVLAGLAVGWGFLWGLDRFELGGNVRVLLHRELVSYFLTPIGHTVMVAFLVSNGITFFWIVQAASGPGAAHGAIMQMMFGGTVLYWMLVLFAAPVLTMRLFAEERRSGTIEALLTAPVSDAQVVAGKYLASMLFYIVLWLPSGLYVGLIHFFAPPGAGPEIGPVLAGYLGTFLVGSWFISVGLLCSALTRSQIVAAILAFSLGGMLMFLAGLGEYFAGPELQSVFNYFNMWDHMRDFGKGIVDTRRVVMYVSVTLLMLYATTKALEARKWR